MEKIMKICCLLWIFLIAIGCFSVFTPPAQGTPAPKQLKNRAAQMLREGKYAEAESYLKTAIKIQANQLGEAHPSTAAIMNNLANLYADTGRFTHAESLYLKVLKTFKQKLGSQNLYTISVMRHLGNLYRKTGELGKAETLLRKAVKILEKRFYKKTESGSVELGLAYGSLASVYTKTGNYGKAEALYNKKIEIMEQSIGPDHGYLANGLNSLALLHVRQGNIDKAEYYLKQALGNTGTNKRTMAAILINLALEVYLQRGDMDKVFGILKSLGVNSSHLLGYCYLVTGEYKKARDHLSQALAMNKDLGMKSATSLVYLGLGISYEGIEDLKNAEKYYALAIKSVEIQRGKLSSMTRQRFLSGKIGTFFSRLAPYEGMIRVIFAQKADGYAEKAFHFAERVKARNLHEMLAARRITGKNEKDSAIIAEDRKFQTQLMMLKKQEEAIKRRPGHQSLEILAGLQESMSRLSETYETFLRDLKLADLELASLLTTDVPSVELVRSLLGKDVTLLEYFIGEKWSYAWIITDDRISMVEIPLTIKDAGALVNNVVLPAVLFPLQNTVRSINVASKQTWQEKAVQNTIEARLNKAYKVLFSPLERQITTGKIVVVPYGVLHKIPFPGLYDGSRYLLDRFEMTVVPSASVLRHLAGKRNPNKGKLLAFSNPKTDAPPLENAQKEVDEISVLFQDQEIYTGPNARESVFKSRCRDSDVIHLACHARFDEKHPLQSGLLLSNDSENDGMLQVHEVFGMDLKEANLVTLSACETGIGKVYGGDDLVGLSRSFIYAGAPAIISSLWSVDDDSTSQMMLLFYKNWLERGMGKAAALRSAQLSIRNMKGFRHPFYWSPFILIGDWK